MLHRIETKKMIGIYNENIYNEIYNENNILYYIEY
jgi:hypothetical protein